MQIKLNGWQRIGVVLSVIWFVGFYWYLWNREEQKAQTRQRAVENQCIEFLSEGEQQRLKIDPLHSNAYLRCVIEGTEAYQAKLGKVSKLSLIAVDFGFLVSWWIAARLLLSVYRWIERGFAADKRS